MLKNISTTIKTGLCLSMLMAPLVQSPFVQATELPETVYTFNKPTEITVTKIDLENNKFWVRILADGKMSGIADKYTRLNLLGMGADDGTRMTDELLSYRAYGRDYIGDSILFLYNVQNRDIEYLPSDEPYEFSATRDLKALAKQWYYWAPMAAPTGGEYIVMGRIDFSECADFIDDKTGYTCEAEAGEDGLYKYGPHDAEGNRVLMPSEIVEEPIVDPIPEDPTPEDPIPGEPTSDEPATPEEPTSEESVTGEITDTTIEPEMKIVEKEVIVEKPIYITKVVTTPVETVHYVYSNANSSAISTSGSNSNSEVGMMADEDKNASERQLEALETKNDEAEAVETEVEVPNLSGTKEEKGFNFWWVIVLVLATASLSFWLLACLKQSKTEEER
ncbi:hypothetical protein IJ765_03590 [Candidatus Saccharibacteria bacterium]|nr:hypothetical protein [Candidatus Saccharibacteria bacterium]